MIVLYLCLGVVSREMLDSMQNADIISTLTKEFNEVQKIMQLFIHSSYLLLICPKIKHDFFYSYGSDSSVRTL